MYDYNFCRLFGKAWIESMTTSNVIGGFHTTGIYPINQNVIQLPGESKLIDCTMSQFYSLNVIWLKMVCTLQVAF